MKYTTLKAPFFLILVALILPLSLTAKDINILDYGAKGDGVTINTKAIQESINACTKSGGGRVIIPAGIFLSGTIYLKSNVNLFIEAGAVLKGSDQISDYRSIHQTLALIIANDLRQVTISGIGIIDGNGEAKNFQKGDTAHGRPMLMFFISCKEVAIKNIKLRNPAFWTQKYLNCDGVLVTGISVHAHANWNNDGIDIDSRNVIISDCRFDTDDDAICLKSERSEPCENITITNCVVASNCNGIKMGTASTSGFRNISISNCVIHHASKDNIRHWKLTLKGITANKTVISGIAIESVDGGHIDQVNISNITMKDVQTPIFIRLGARSEPAGSLQHININNIIATSESEMCNIISGIPGHKVEDVMLHDILLINHASGEWNKPLNSIPENINGYPENRIFGFVSPASGFYIRHAKNIQLESVVLDAGTKEKRPFLVADDVEYLQVRKSGISKKSGLVYPYLYCFRNVFHAAITLPVFLPDFTTLFHVGGKSTRDINLFLQGNITDSKIISFDRTIKDHRTIKVFSLSGN